MSRKNGSMMTTGDVARTCHVAIRTATKWIDQGLLASYRLPGSGQRRIHRVDFDEFISRSGFLKDGRPIPIALTLGCAIEPVDGLELVAATSPFHTGYLAHRDRPEIIVIAWAMGWTEASRIAQECRFLEGYHPFLIIASTINHPAEALVWFHAQIGIPAVGSEVKKIFLDWRRSQYGHQNPPFDSSRLTASLGDRSGVI